MADVTWTDYAFPTSEPTATTKRKLPDRLANNVKNVKDYGATGNGSTNDLPFIQAAVDDLWGQPTHNTSQVGTIFFPPGTYLVNGPITFNPGSTVAELGIAFRGVGTASKITGNFNGGIIQRWYLGGGDGVAAMPCIIESLWLNQDGEGEEDGYLSAAGSHCIFAVGCAAIMIRNVLCTTKKNGIGLENTQGSSVYNCHVICTGTGPNRFGIHPAGNCTITSCYIKGFTVGVRASQIGGCTTNCVITNNDLGFEGGPYGTDTYLAGAITGARTLTNISNPGSFVTTNASGIDASGHFTASSKIGTNSAGDFFTVSSSSVERLYFGENIVSTPVATFCKQAPSNPFITPFLIMSNRFENNITGMYWNQAGNGLVAGNTIVGGSGAAYGMRSKPTAPHNCIFAGNTFSGTFSVAAVTTANNNGHGGGEFFLGVTATNSGAGVDWGQEQGNNLVSNTYINSNSVGPASSHVFAGLPTSTDRVVGQTFWITDCNTAVWSATAAAGGSNHVKVRWNGTAWTVVGK